VNADPGYDKDSKMAGEETQLEAENSDLIAPKVHAAWPCPLGDELSRYWSAHRTVLKPYGAWLGE
jgi:hypothetical protein